MNISQFLALHPNLTAAFNGMPLKDQQNFIVLLYNMSHQPNATEDFRAFHYTRNFNMDDLIQLMEEGRRESWFPLRTEVCLIVCYAVIIAFSLALNAAVCFVVIRLKRLHTTQNAFIVNLALADMIMVLTCMPFTLVKLLFKNWTYGDFLCKLVPYLQALTVFMSTLSITAIAVDRFYVLANPERNFNDSKSMTSVFPIIGIIWTISVFVGVPLAVFSQVKENHYVAYVKFNMCLEQWPSIWSRALYATCILVIQFVLPIIMLMTIHTRICSFFRFRIVRMPSTPFETRRRRNGIRRHRQNMALLVTITTLFVVCWLPLTLLNLLADIDYRLFMHRYFLLGYAIAHMIAMASACFNPLIYGWFNPNFRREMSNAILCKRPRPLAGGSGQHHTRIDTTRTRSESHLRYHTVSVQIQLNSTVHHLI